MFIIYFYPLFLKNIYRIQGNPPFAIINRGDVFLTISGDSYFKFTLKRAL